MTSQKSTDEVLNDFENLTHDELREKIEELLPILISSLNAEDDSCKTIRVLRILLHSCLPFVKIQSADRDVFQHALPALKHLFYETMNGIHFKLQSDECSNQLDVVDHLEGLLKISIVLLECLDGSLQYVISKEQVGAREMPSLSKNVADILLGSFKHCKESEQIYGTLFQSLGDDLSTLFKKSHAIQEQLILVLSSSIKFSCSYEEDLVHLIEVLEVMEEIGEVVTGLDIKTMACQWKFYAKVLKENVENLKERIEISRPIKFLSRDIMNGLKTVLKSDLSDSKSVERTLKPLNFTLKIVMLLCELYAGYLGDCHEELLNLMLYLLSNSEPRLQVIQVPKNVINNVESYLVVGVEPLVSRLMEENTLAKEYLKWSRSLPENEDMKLGFLLLSMMIMKNLLHCDESIRRNWLAEDPDSNLIAVVFRSLSLCHVELIQDIRIKGSCKGPTVGGTGATHGLYEALLIHLSAFISTISAENFPHVEQLLLENILQGNGNVWRALMACDVWCMISRCGSAELCYKHVSQLAKLSLKMLDDLSCPEACHIRVILQRLFSLLSSKGIVQMCEQFPPVSYPRLWRTFGFKKLPEQMRVVHLRDLIMKAIQEMETFSSNPISAKACESVMDAVLGASAALESSTSENIKNDNLSRSFATKLITFWTFITQCSDSQENGHCLRWLDKIFNDLLVSTSGIVAILSNNQILQVLDVLLNNYSRSLYLIKIGSLRLFRSMATKFFESDMYQSQVCQKIAKTFSLLMRDENKLIRQKSLEVFTYFSQITQHEQIVALSVNGCKEVKKMVEYYLKKIPSQVPSQRLISINDYLRDQACKTSIHHCLSSDPSYPANFTNGQPKCSENVNKTATQIHKDVSVIDNQGCANTAADSKCQKRKADENLLQVVKRMKEDINYMTEEYSLNILPSEVKVELQEMINKLTSIAS